MGLYDEFIPEPEIKCPKCGGKTSGWQGKPSSGPALFVWKQGVTNPINQDVDEDIKIDEKDKVNITLPDEFCIYGGSCESCDFTFQETEYVFAGKCENGTWTKTFLEPENHAKQVEKNWIQCEYCLNIWESDRKKTHDYCPDCNKLVEINWNNK